MSANLGEFLSGDRILSSPYLVKMKTDMFCEQVCMANLGRLEQKGHALSKIVKAIHMDYHANWILDNLPAASKTEDDNQIVTRYWQGVPLGYVDNATNMAYVYNHVNIEVGYHEVESDPGHYRIVQFSIQPFSINHDFEPNLDPLIEDGNYLPSIVKINNPIDSCALKSNVHTTFAMLTAPGREAQRASGHTLFTYDVIWTENKQLHWANRWDVYLTMDNAIPPKVHWLGITKGLIVVFILSATIAAIMVNNFHRDVIQYNKIAADEELLGGTFDESWKLVHSDVFRPPNHSLLLSVFCGTGVQLLGTSLLLILFTAFGLISPARRGHMILAQLFVFVLLGSLNGYVTARLYKTFDGSQRQRATTAAAIAFPGLAFSMSLILYALALHVRSTYAIPFTCMLTLVVLWLGITTPLVFLGASLGYKHDVIVFPVETSSIPRQIPDQPWFMGLPFTVAVGGVLSFASCFVELHFILTALWMDCYYYAYGFLLLVFLILVTTCAQSTILLTYFQLCKEDYHWWWRSFCNAGSLAIYVFMYSIIYYYNQLKASTLTSYIIYFGFMAFFSTGLFMMMGCIGVFSSLLFNQKLFSTIKIT
jgi:transmembrane 9 superfamily protein 2/4